MKSEACSGSSRCGMVLGRMGSCRGVFADLEEFVGTHRGCGVLTGGADEPTPDGYLLRITCSCGVVFERWVTPEAAENDLIRSRLLTSQN